jgi:hypothetical protein
VTADDFATSVDRLINQVAHWEQARWWSGSTADLMYALIQRLSDLDSEAESMQHRQVPRLSDLTLPAGRPPQAGAGRGRHVPP